MRTVNSARNPQWADADHTVIDLLITFEELESTFGEIPFTATSTAAEDFVKAIYDSAVKGDYGPVADYAPPVVSADELAARARFWRDQEITDSQWLIERHRDQSDAGSKTTLTAAQYSALLVYRQALRDWPTVQNFPADASKPVAPDWLAAAEAELSAA